jgi:branched-subunit amino acid transport protein AzlD
MSNVNMLECVLSSPVTFAMAPSAVTAVITLFELTCYRYSILLGTILYLILVKSWTLYGSF